jgi:ElaB/YqjD/DUF883 family membrane-anchored ribosome-binding protein
MTEEIDTPKILETLTAKVDELTKAVNEKKEYTEGMILETLTAKVDELTKAVNEKKEYTEGKIGENPLAYVAGAFAGGLIVGYLMASGKG